MRHSRARTTFAAVLALALSACADESPAPVVQLNAAQADAIRASVTDAVTDLTAKGRDDLAWLADSASLVIRAGARVDSIAIVETDGLRWYFAVGLHRRIEVNAQATFHLIAFDALDNPTRLVVSSAYATSLSGSPPQSAFGNFDFFDATVAGVQLKGWMFQLGGSGIRAWRAINGDGGFATVGVAPGCGGFTALPGVTCESSRLQASFVMSTALEVAPAPGASELRSATLTLVSVPAIVLTFAAP